MFGKLPSYIKYIFLVYIAGIAFFTLFRIAFVLAHFDFAKEIPLSILAQAFFMGFRFDTVVSCYIISVPFLILATLSFFKMDVSKLLMFTNIYFLLVYAFSFFVCGVDIPYFTHFNNRFTHAALFWFDTPAFIVKIVLSTPLYDLYLLFFIILSVIFFLILKKIRKKILWTTKEIAPAAKPFLFAAAAGLIFLGVRGKIEWKSPIRWSTAFFCEYSFANQMGLNPVFTLAKTTIDSYKPENQRLNFMSDDEAISNVRNYLHVAASSKGIERKKPIPNPSRWEGGVSAQVSLPFGEGRGGTYNVVIVIMESMSANYLKTLGNKNNLTPVLDSLMNVSYAFTNYYSAGTHTFNGVYSTLFSMPALLAKHPMKDFDNMNQKSGIANELKNKGYQTLFMCTHDEHFDNMGGYMPQNGFQKVVSQKDFSEDEILSPLGVPDHILFREVIGHCNNLRQPFFTAVLTASNHPPVVIPENIDFIPSQENIDLKGVQYADWSIGQFLKNAKKEKWFDSTIFIFLGDHGRVVGPGYDMPLSYHHIPLIIYAPEILNEPKKFAQLGSQLDLMPIVMGLLNIDFINTTLGTDILNERRDFVFFNADNNLGCLNDSAYYVQRESGVNSLYLYKNGDMNDYLEKYPELAAQMKLYVESMMQAAQGLRGK